MATELPREMPTEEQRKARLGLSTRFLDEVLLPRLQTDTLKTAEEIKELYKNFQEENRGLGSDFDLANVWQIAAMRDLHNDHLAEKAPGQLPEDAADVAIAEYFLAQVVFGE